MSEFVAVEVRLLLETFMADLALPRTVQIVDGHVTFYLRTEQKSNVNAYN